MKRRRLSAKTNLILTVAWSIVLTLFFYFFSDTPHFIACCAACPIAIGYMIYAYFKEKRDDRKAQELKPEIEDGSYFSSPEQREKHLEFAQSGGWEQMKAKDMKEDMCLRYKSGNSRAMILMGSFFLVISPALLLSDEPLILLPWLALTAFVLYMGISEYMGMPVRRWLKGTKYDRESLERSYSGGKLLTNGKYSINFGHEFIIITTPKSVYAFRPRQAENSGRKVVRVKNYQNDVYAGNEYRYFLTVSVKDSYGHYVNIECWLKEPQLELALDEMRRVISQYSSSHGNQYDTAREDDVIT